MRKKKLRPAFEVREVHKNAPPDVLAALLTCELVHPMDDVGELANRLCNRAIPGWSRIRPTLYSNHAYAILEKDSPVPKNIIYIKLLRVPTRGGRVSEQDLTGDILDVLDGKNKKLDGPPNVAIFYSTSKLGDLTEGLLKGPGEYLIKQAVVQLLRDYPKLRESLRCFSTLSPARQELNGKVSGFRLWLEPRLQREAESPVHFTNAEEKAITSMAEKAGLDVAHQAVGELFLELYKSQPRPQGEPPKSKLPRSIDASDYETLRRIMHGLSLEYFISHPNQSKKGNKIDRSKVDGVSGFHLSNGAKLANVHAKPAAEVKLRDWEQGFGVMANYLYEIDMGEVNAALEASEKNPHEKLDLTKALHSIDARKSAFRDGVPSRLDPAGSDRRHIAAAGHLVMEQHQRQRQLRTEGKLGFADVCLPSAPAAIYL